MVFSYDHMKKDINTLLTELGMRIKQERKQRGLSQTQLGEITSTSINFISQVEAGKATAQIGKVFRVLQVLGIELHYKRGSQGLVFPASPDKTPILIKNRKK